MPRGSLLSLISAALARDPERHKHASLPAAVAPMTQAPRLARHAASTPLRGPPIETDLSAALPARK